MPYRKAEIRSYTDGDEAVLFNLARASFGEEPGWSDPGTLAVLREDTVFVAEVERAPAGYVALERADDAVRIEQLLVSPEHTEEGVGHQLLEWAEGYAISLGARSLEIVVETDNRRALDFYHRFGFVEAGGDVLELPLPQQ
jgi:ribosomal protein S18 acetylase RimI-like enzyme